MNKTAFVYVTYINASPEQVWRALTEPGFTSTYWGYDNISDWKPGSRWEHRRQGEAGKPLITGVVKESVPPERLVITWAEPGNEDRPEARSRVTFELKPIKDMVCLTVTHDELEEGSDMLRSISEGWPRVLSSLKSFLETGKPLDTWSGKK